VRDVDGGGAEAGLQPGDLGVENGDPGAAVGVRLGVEPADCPEDRGDPVLAERGPVPGEVLDELERLLGVRGQRVDLLVALVERADQPLAAHPALAQLLARAVRHLRLAGQPDLGEVLLDLRVQPGGRDRPVVAAERRPEDGDHDGRLALVEQRQRRLRERALDARQLAGDVAHRLPRSLVPHRCEETASQTAPISPDRPRTRACPAPTKRSP